MSIKNWIIFQFAKTQKKAIGKMASNAISDQNKWFKYLIEKGGQTKFGQDHEFTSIDTIPAFQKKVPIRNYEDLKPYVEGIIEGRSNILWPGKPKYFGKTSGTTSGVKYIPISQESIKFHIKTARNTILNYIAITRKNVFSGKMIFLSGSPELEDKGGIATGRLSGIVNHEVPAWVRPNQLPSYQTNCIEEWEPKLDKIVDETYLEDMSLISGIPPWVQMYYERLQIRSGKSTMREIFPNLKLFIHGGVNYKPYQPILEKLHGTGVDTLETYPASEGFIAFQDTLDKEGLLLNTNAGMFFEFVEAQNIHDTHPTRLTLKDVELNVDYALIITSNAGLWAYNIGDTIRFVSKSPYRVIVSGRIKHFISAFGEHVISKEVEEAMNIVSSQYKLTINEFTVAPQINPSDDALPYHEWFVEFDVLPEQLEPIEKALDKAMRDQNIYYDDLINGNVLRHLKIRPLEKDAFRSFMKSQGKLGGQNKVPRLTNDRQIADALQKYVIKAF
ncbi:MAG: GH3 auxin-responsive promoter family protein [Saprospiraceae bacterium]|nr:GH3 auxin-responsive promoter family protein [Saprospiraceae bacterium]